MLTITRCIDRLRQRKRNAYLARLVRKGLVLGKNVQLAGEFFLDPSHCYLISIGDDCTLAPHVRLIAHDASTKAFLGRTRIGKIQINQGCFIGDSVIVLPNVCIGPRSIVGAGSLVTSDIPPNSVAAGNPARVLCSLQAYLDKIMVLGEKAPFFGRDYHLEYLTPQKIQEIRRAVEISAAFML